MVSVINGNGEFWEPYAGLLGCRGFASGIINFAPELSVSIYKADLKKDYDQVFEIKRRLQPFIEFFFKATEKYGMSVEPDLLKAAACIAGSNVGRSKMPVTKLSQEEREELGEALKKCAIV